MRKAQIQRRHLLGSRTCLVTAVLLTGCGLAANLDEVKPGAKDTGDIHKEDSETGSSTSSELETDSDTPTDTSCPVVDCADKELVCWEDAGICVQCARDGDCSGNFACDQMTHTCFATCTPPNLHCAKGSYCESDKCLEQKKDGQKCSPDKDYECQSRRCENGYCCQSGKCCSVYKDCSDDANAPLCSSAYNCVPCNDSIAPKNGCQLGYPATPYCKTGGPSCVECNEHLHCIADTSEEPDTDRPYLSPLGACTPDHTCTCWVSPNDDLQDNCGDCDDAGEEFVCARDYDDGASLKSHTACLRKCQNKETQAPMNGLRCVKRGSEYVWLPPAKASCFSFWKFGQDCSTPDPPSDANCSVDGSGDISGNFKDASCQDFGGALGYRCTYDCWDLGSEGTVYYDSWCVATSRCRNQADTPPQGICHPPL